MEKRLLLVKYRGKRKQKDMAKMYGVSQQVWSRWECGIATPSVTTMKRLEDDIGKPMEKIFFDVFNTPKASKSNPA